MPRISHYFKQALDFMVLRRAANSRFRTFGAPTPGSGLLGRIHNTNSGTVLHPMRLSFVGNQHLPSESNPESQERFLTTLIEYANTFKPAIIANCLLKRYQSIEGVFRALVDSLDNDSRNQTKQDTVAKPDLARLLVTLAEADFQEPQIGRELLSYLVQTLGNRQDEALLALFLGPKSTCLDAQILAYGSEREVAIGTRRLLRAAIQCGATSMILAHNHPSGNVEPSEMDYQSTFSAEAAAKVVGVELIDHLIVAGQQVFSIRHSCCVIG